MGLTHTPRVIATVTRGLWQHYRTQHARVPAGTPGLPATYGSGFSVHDPYIYHGRAGLLDVDYLGHLNNASYLQHAELARWGWTSSQGWLTTLMRDNCHFVLASSTVRFRREIRPLFRTFQIDTFVIGLDDKNTYVLQNFRYPPDTGKTRIRAQVLIRGVLTKDRQVVNPMEYYRDRVGIDEGLLESLRMKSLNEMIVQQANDLEDDEEELVTRNVLQHFLQLEDSMRNFASVDDKTHDGI